MKLGLSKLGRAVEHAGYVRAIEELASVSTLVPAGEGYLALIVPETFLDRMFAIASDEAEPEEPEGDVLDNDEDEVGIPGWATLAAICAIPLLIPYVMS